MFNLTTRSKTNKIVNFLLFKFNTSFKTNKSVFHFFIAWLEKCFWVLFCHLEFFFLISESELRMSQLLSELTILSELTTHICTWHVKWIFKNLKLWNFFYMLYTYVREYSWILLNILVRMTKVPNKFVGTNKYVNFCPNKFVGYPELTFKCVET